MFSLNQHKDVKGLCMLSSIIVRSFWLGLSSLGPSECAVVLAVLLLPLLGARCWAGSFARRRYFVKAKTLFSYGFLVPSAVFLLTIPCWEFARSVGIAPGLVFIYLFVRFIQRLSRKGDLLSNIGGIALLAVFLWVWGEAGQERYVVMPVDIPDSPQALKIERSGTFGNDSSGSEFTSEGVANALETEIECFASRMPEWASQTEANSIFAGKLKDVSSLQNAWLKVASPYERPCHLDEANAPHILSTIELHEFPLAHVYHILRHIRGKPMIESQLLVGDDDTLTLAIRQVNYERECITEETEKEVIESLRTEGRLGQLLKVLDNGRSGRCLMSPWRHFLTALDLMPPEVEEERRIANQTIYRLKGDARLTELLQISVLEAMQQLSPERVALYYDQASRFESALTWYKKALPRVLADYDGSPKRSGVRERLVNVLIRTGDLDTEIPPTSGLTRPAYEIALSLSPDDPKQAMRVGYHYLSRAEQSIVENIDPDRATVSEEARDLENALRYFALAHQNRNWENQLKSKYKDNRALIERNWLLANLAVTVSLLKQNPKLVSEGSAELLAKEDTDDLRICLIDAAATDLLNWSARRHECDTEGCVCPSKPTAQDSANAVLTNSNDLRAVAAWYFGWKVGQFPDPNVPDEAFYAAAERIEANNAHEPNTPTANNLILIEDQLATPKKATPLSATGEHSSKRFLLRALRHYRYATDPPTCAYARAIDLTNRARETPSPSARSNDESLSVIKLAHAYSVVTADFFLTNEHSPGQCGKELIDSEIGLDSEIADLANNPNLGAVRWRAISLDLMRITMCIPSVNHTCPSGGWDARLALASELVKALADDPYAHRSAALAYMRAGEGEKAVFQLHQAVRLNRGDPFLRALFGVALNRNGNIEEAQQQWKTGQLLDPDRWEQTLAVTLQHLQFP